VNVPGAPAVSAAPVTLFYSYAHEDEGLRDELQGHLKILERRGLLAPWHDRRIVAGENWSGAIDVHLRSAELVLLLVSKDFINSDYIMGIELHAAMQRHAEQRAVVVPIVVRAVDLDPDDSEDLPFMKLQGLPTGLRPVTSWPNRDEAWTDVAKGLRAAVKGIRERRVPVEPDPRLAAPASEPEPMVLGAPPVASAPRSGVSWWPKFGRKSAPVPEVDLLAPDPVLVRLVTGVAQQIEQAQRERHQPPLDARGAEALRAGTLKLIDLPEQKRVLWVDDRPEGNRFEMAAFARLQIEVVTAFHTDEALQRIETDSEGFDLVISDWERDGEASEAGLRLLAELRRLAQSLPLIFYHGAYGERRAERTAQALMAGAFAEVVTPAELMQRVQKALSG
jgi:CheY-like chemotaxis protein